MIGDVILIVNRLWRRTRLPAYFHIDPSRSAQAGMELFAKTTVPVHLVCDRYAAYNKISTLLCDRVTLAFCWAHVRRDFLKAAGRETDLFAWREGWITRIGGIYHLNKRRCAEEADSLSIDPCPAGG